MTFIELHSALIFFFFFFGNFTVTFSASVSNDEKMGHFLELFGDSCLLTLKRNEAVQNITGIFL